MPKASVIALSAIGEGPYGFSFELKRTTPGRGTDAFSNEVDGLASDSSGRAARYAAPAPKSCANLRRFIDDNCSGILSTSDFDGHYRGLIRESQQLNASDASASALCYAHFTDAKAAFFQTFSRNV
jgi:hypothetical protein